MSDVFIILKNGTNYQVNQEDIIGWQNTYKDIDVYRELDAMASWCDANPQKRKTQKGVKRFINSWLQRANTVGGSPALSKGQRSVKQMSSDEMIADVTWLPTIDQRSQASYFLKKYGFYFLNGERHEE